jgi:hypothetical protein
MTDRVRRVLIRVLPTLAAVVALTVLSVHAGWVPEPVPVAATTTGASAAPAAGASCGQKSSDAHGGQLHADAAHCVAGTVPAMANGELHQESRAPDPPASRPLPPGTRPVNTARSPAELQVSLR